MLRRKSFSLLLSSTSHFFSLLLCNHQIVIIINITTTISTTSLTRLRSLLINHPYRSLVLCNLTLRRRSGTILGSFSVRWGWHAKRCTESTYVFCCLWCLWVGHRSACLSHTTVTKTFHAVPITVGIRWWPSLHTRALLYFLPECETRCCYFILFFQGHTRWCSFH